MLTKNYDSMFMCSIRPHGWRNSDHLMSEIVKNVYVLPMVEGIGFL